VFPEVPKGFQLYYLDEEEDQISVNSQTELDEAKRLSKLIIRLIVHLRESNPQSQPQTQPQTQPQPQTLPQNTSREEAKPSQNPQAQNSFVQTLVFIQPYLTNPRLLKTVLPFLLSEMNKNNYIPQEEIEKLNQMGDKLLEYPAIQDFLSSKLPKILQQVTGPTTTSDPSPSPTTTTSDPSPSPTTPTATEQIQDLVMPFVSMAQSFAQNISQNINSQLTPNKQEGSQFTPSSTPSNPEPKKSVKENWSHEPYYNFLAPTFPSNCNNPSPAPSKYDNELKQLKELGFEDTQLLKDLLTDNYGDINRVIDILSDFK